MARIVECRLEQKVDYGRHTDPQTENWTHETYRLFYEALKKRDNQKLIEQRCRASFYVKVHKLKIIVLRKKISVENFVGRT